MKAFHVACAIALSAHASAQPASNPWFGTWKLRLKTSDEKPETLIYSDAGNGAIRMHSVEENSVIVTRWDGKPASDTGPKGNGKPTLAVKAISPTRYTWTFFRDGKPYIRGTNTLAPDRMTFTEVSWLISRPGKTATLIYDRR